MINYFNGNFLEEDLCKVSPFDRGFLFSDGVYEVIRYTGKRFLEFDSHLERLKSGLEFMKINYGETEKLIDICNELIQKNNLMESGAILYMQITRGISNPRNHLFPVEADPTIIASVTKFLPQDEKLKRGVKIILQEDIRWSGCNIKTTALIPNILARQKAFEQNAVEAVFIRNDVVTEGTHTSFCGVKNEYLIIPPLSNHILPGITRKIVLNLCEELDIPYLERNINEEELRTFDEFMLLSTKMDVTPVVQIEGIKINDGMPGEITLQMQKAYIEMISS